MFFTQLILTGNK